MLMKHDCLQVMIEHKIDHKHKSAAHNRRRQQKTGREEKDLTAARTLLFGALAGATAESILYPLEVLRRRFV